MQVDLIQIEGHVAGETVGRRRSDRLTASQKGQFGVKPGVGDGQGQPYALLRVIPVFVGVQPRVVDKIHQNQQLIQGI